MSLPTEYKNGDDVHFDYLANLPATGASSASKRKKKNKKKKKALASANVQATLTDPDAEYPTSRVIKQAPNGDVIVESLDEDHHSHDHGYRANIWDNSSVEEQENLKRYWESLDESQKMKLVKIDKKSIMELFRSEAKAALAHHQAQQATNHCTCSYCGRRSNVIEDELENIYDNHFDDIIDFIHEVRDINDLNALPGLLFGGFHMLEEEHKLMKRQHRERRHDHSHDHHHHDHDHHHDHHHDHEYEQEYEHEHHHDCDHDHDHEELDAHDHHDHIHSNPNAYDVSQLRESLSTYDAPETDNTELLSDVLEPKLMEVMKRFNASDHQGISNHLIGVVSKAANFKARALSLSASEQYEMKSLFQFLDLVTKMFSGDPGKAITNGEIINNLKNFDDKNELANILKFAEEFMVSDGNSFIDMLENLSELRTAREDLLKEADARLDHSEQQLEQIRQYKALQGQLHQQPPEEAHEHFEDELEEIYDEEEEEEAEELEDLVSDAESEISEEEKMQEIRRLFLIQVIKLFQERLKALYKEKLSQDRTQKLIEELEAEENAKKERENKKLKQKEKAKEKKRLQQLAKEEERKRKEEEQKAKEDELRLRQEELRQEQKRKKEEARAKREEEKRKRIEELKRKEEENQKRLEAQRKKEEEAHQAKEAARKAKEAARLEREQLEREKALAEKLERERVEKERQAASIPIAPTSNASPVKNHILDQLYQAKPRTHSGSGTPLVSTLPLNDTFQLPDLPNSATAQLPSLLPNAFHLSPFQQQASPWAPQPSLDQPLSQPVFQQNTTFAPFSNDTFTDPFAAAPATPAAPASNGSMWNGSRNNSIWGTKPVASTPSLWADQQFLPEDIVDEATVQQATYEAFALLQNSGQLEFGMAPNLKLFHMTKSVLQNQGLTIVQFLNSLRNTGGLSYRFDFVYDDMGTVTHVKAGTLVPRGPIKSLPPPGLNGESLLGSLSGPSGQPLNRLWN